MVVDSPDVLLVARSGLHQRDADLALPKVDVRKLDVGQFDGRTPVCYSNRTNSTSDGRRAGMLEYPLNVLGRDGHDGVVRIAALLEHLDLLLERNQWETEQNGVESPAYKMDYPMGTP